MKNIYLTIGGRVKLNCHSIRNKIMCTDYKTNIWNYLSDDIDMNIYSVISNTFDNIKNSISL